MSEGCQINLDEGEGTVIEGYIEDCIHDFASYLYIKFEVLEPIVLNSDPNEYITFYNTNWVPLTCHITKNDKTDLWEYDLKCYPKCMFTMIDHTIRTTGQLASEMGLELSGSSASLDLPCPYINVFPGNFMKNNRFYSLEKSFQEKGNFTEAMYIFTDGRYLISNTWKSIISQTAYEIPINPFSGNTLYTLINEQLYDVYACRRVPEVFKEVDYFYNMIGSQFKLETNIPVPFFGTCTIKPEHIEEFNANEAFLCIQTTKDLKSPTPYTHYLAMMKIE